MSAMELISGTSGLFMSSTLAPEPGQIKGSFCVVNFRNSLLLRATHALNLNISATIYFVQNKPEIS